MAQRWKYNDVEFEEGLGLDLYEMPLRNYDPALGRFTTMDPVTHFDYSTYSAFDNNPVFWADPSGADSEGFDSADGLTNQQWLNLTRPSFNENRNFDAQRVQSRQNFNDEITRRGQLENGEGEFEDQETKEKVSAFLYDIIKFLVTYARYNAEIQYRRDNNMAHMDNVQYPNKDIKLNSSYAAPNANSEDYSLMDGINRFSLDFNLTLEGHDFGNVELTYFGGNRIDHYEPVNQTSSSIWSDRIGDALQFNHSSRNTPVGLMIFNSRQLRDKFDERYYHFSFSKAYYDLYDGTKSKIKN